MADDPTQVNPNEPSTDTSARQPYLVIARRYRPLSFSDLIGQAHVGQALSNAIATNRVGHAYLFTGARGVGKTSTARILAKALNAPEGPTATPDPSSDICRSIDAGTDIDVLEIDGASNRGIEEIRQLRANINVRPSRARYKIYIIDEVHMLTTAAFNALLKTLEEPPEHVKFIFCTTDPEKIPITVLSRCQRFDFSPVKSDEIAERLQHIVDQEGLTAEPEALRLLARRANGSMRDSQSLLEQLLSYCSESITVDQVHELLGTVKGNQLGQLAEAILARDAATALRIIDQMVRDGVELGLLLDQLIGHFRDMMAAAVGCSAELLLNTQAAELEALAAHGKAYGLINLLAVLQILDKAYSQLRFTSQVRAAVEVAVVQCASLADLAELSTIAASLTGSGGGASPARPAREESAASQPASAKSPPLRLPPAPAKASATEDTKPPQKKTPEIESPSGEPGHSHQPLDPERAGEIWAQALSAIEDMTRDMAQFASSQAISAPNILVVSFPEEYTLQKEYCERPERKQKLESALQRVASQPVVLQFESVANVVAKTPAPRKPTGQSRREAIRDSEKHPLVREAIKVFDAEVTRVDRPRHSS